MSAKFDTNKLMLWLGRLLGALTIVLCLAIIVGLVLAMGKFLWWLLWL